MGSQCPSVLASTDPLIFGGPRSNYAKAKEAGQIYNPCAKIFKNMKIKVALKSHWA